MNSGDYVSYTKKIVTDLLQSFSHSWQVQRPTPPRPGKGTRILTAPAKTIPFKYSDLMGATSFIMRYTLIDSDGFYKNL